MWNACAPVLLKLALGICEWGKHTFYVFTSFIGRTWCGRGVWGVSALSKSVGWHKELLFSSIKRLRRNPRWKKRQISTCLSDLFNKEPSFESCGGCAEFTSLHPLLPIMWIACEKGHFAPLEGTIFAAGGCLVHQVRHVLVRDHLFTQTNL